MQHSAEYTHSNYCTCNTPRAHALGIVLDIGYSGSLGGSGGVSRSRAEFEGLVSTVAEATHTRDGGLD